MEVEAIRAAFIQVNEERITRTRRVQDFQDDGTRFTEERTFSGDELIEILEFENRSYAVLLELKNREVSKLRERLRSREEKA